MDRFRDKKPLQLKSEIREIPGQSGFITRLNNKKVCFVCKGGISWFGYDCMKALTTSNVKFDALALDGISEEDLGDIVDKLDIDGMTRTTRHRTATPLQYDVYVIGNEIDEEVMRSIYNSISIDTKFPTVISKYDFFMDDTFSDCFLSTRTHSVNTMRHGAELS